MNVLTKILLITIIPATAVAIWYHLKTIHDAEWEETNALIAQGGQLVVMHRVLSRDTPNYKQLSFMRTLAQEAQEKLRSKDKLIRKYLPPENTSAYDDMRDRLNNITESATH